VAVVFVLVYWAVVFALPTHGSAVGLGVPLPMTVAMIVVGLGGAGALVAGVVRNNATLICGGGFLVLVDLLFASAFHQWVVYTMELKFAVGIGGAALASFAFGIVVYDTLRVAASLPIVVVVIGLATFPAGYAGGDAIRGQIILWMGGILGIAATAEGVTQAFRIRGSANVRSEMVKANAADGKDAARLDRDFADMASIGGDLAPPMGAPSAGSGSSQVASSVGEVPGRSTA
jgi:hypothetical protein